ncbi:MAG: dockerin type I repeat-containing protein [candidate division Zixibacteria bacterium]|nr:dockerin type I repeat-containing protein [candidate division Zixibacteria bacterium]
MIRILVVTVLLVGFLTVAVTADESTATLDAGVEPVALQLIEQEYESGSLTLDEKVRLQITAIKYPEKLPDRFHAPSLSSAITTIGLCGTPVIDDIRSQWDALSTETKGYFLAAFARIETEFTYLSPSGFFWFHYDTSGVDSIPSADDDSSGVPDFIEKCAAYCDSALARHIDLGYLLPPSDGELGGDSLYDMYFEETGLYGYTMPEGPGSEPWNDYYSYIMLNNDFLGFSPNNDPEGDQAGAAKATCAHEFHHSCQFAYDVSEPTWIKEHDAVYFEDIVFDATDDNYQYLEAFMQEPEKSLMDNGSHAYGSFIWAMYLAEKFDTSLMVAMWEGAIWDNAFDALADTIETRYGWTIDSAFAEFTVWNSCTDIRDDGLHYEESSQYHAVDIARSHTFYPVTLQTSPKNPAGYGSCYIDFFPGTETGILKLAFNGNDNREWSAYVVKSLTENTHEFEKIELDAISKYGTIDIPLFETYYRVTLVGANLSEYSEGAFFSYSADVRPPYSVESEILTTDSAVYSGDTRDFEYMISNTSVLNDIYRITSWDTCEWITPDSFDVPILAGDDSVVTIPVHPVQGTPLDNISSLTFKVWSRNDTTVVDSQFIGAKIVLQHGDVNFNGSINVSDITYLVTYLFDGGPEPAPVILSGDSSCNGEVNISDVTVLVNYLFQEAPPPSCNPY